jgi:uncharacterized protein YaaQ
LRNKPPIHVHLRWQSAGASLALTADPKVVETPWGQVIDAVIGVEIAISLIPPAAVVGIGLAFGDLAISYHALLLTIANVLGLDLFGSMFMLTLRGIRYKYLLMENQIRQTVESGLVAIPNIWLGEFAINVTLLGENVATIHVIVRNDNANKVSDALAGNGFYITRLASTGGFLRMGNTVFINSIEDDQLDKMLKIIRTHSDVHVQLPSSRSLEEIRVSRAVVFVQYMEQLLIL